MKSGVAGLLAAGLLAGVTAAGTAAAAEPCTAEQGQNYIDEGDYNSALLEFTCVIEAQPTEVEGYRGRIEAQLRLERFSDALRDYARVTAFVEPVHPDAESTILAGYAERLAANPLNVDALSGASFARWYFFDYAQAIQLLNDLLDVRPDDLYGNLFRGSSRLLRGATPFKGIADLERALALAPQSPDVRHIVADAYLYGRADYQRAFDEATLALDWGLDTPRVHAILASAHHAFGDELASAGHIRAHLDLVTTELVTVSAIAEGTTLSLGLVPGRTYEIPVETVAGETLSIRTSSQDFYDTILLLVAPDGSPVLGSDDFRSYYAGLDWVAEASGTYRLLVTSFEAINTGELRVRRK